MVDSAARRKARRLHHNQIIRRSIVAALLVAFAGAISAVGVVVVNQLRAVWMLEAAGFTVDWQLDGDTWMSGGVSSVAVKRGNWLQGPHDLELKILPRLLNVESVSLMECEVTEQGLAPLSQLSQLKSLNLSRENHLRYGTSLAGLTDACLVPIQGLSQLQSLTLSGNKITDDGLALIGGLRQLDSLDLTGTDVTNAGLVHLKPLKKLKLLCLGGTFVTPEAVRALQAETPGLDIEFQIDPEFERNLKESRRVR